MSLLKKMEFKDFETELDEATMNEFQDNIDKSIADQEEKIITLQKTVDTQGKIIEGLESELEPAPPVEGIDLNIQGTAQARAKIIPVANTYQESREGYNLLNISEGTETKNNSTVTVLGEEVLINGATGTTGATAFYTIGVTKIPSLNGTYTIKIIPISGSWTSGSIGITFRKSGTQLGYIQINRGSSIANKELVIEGIDQVCLYVSNTPVMENFKFKIMFYQGTDDKEYEAYGVTPSPSIPSPIAYVRGKFESYNLINTTRQSDQTVNGVSAIYNGDGTYTLNGTSTAQTDIYIESKNWGTQGEIATLKAGKNYTMSIGVAITGLGMNLYSFNPSSQNIKNMISVEKVIFSPTTDIIANLVYIRVNAGVTLNNVIIKPMLYEGKDDKPYLPYGTVENVYEIKKQNKNLFNKNNLSYELGYKDTNGNIQTSTLTGYTTMKIPVSKNTEYTIGKLLTTDKNSSTANAVVNAIYFHDKNYNYITRTDSIKTYNAYNFTTPENCSFIEFQITINPTVADGNTFYDIIDTFMLLKGNYSNSTFPIYISYEEEIFQLNLGDYKLAEVGESKDHFDISYVDENGYKKITNVDYVEKFLNVTLDGGLNDGYTYIRATTSSEDHGYRFMINGILGLGKHSSASVKPNLICSHFKTGTPNNTWGGLADNIITSNNNVKKELIIYSTQFKESTLEEFKTWVSENNINVLYELETPITTKVTDENLISQLEALLNVMTYKEVTNVSTSKSVDVEEVAELKVSLEYLMSNLSRIKNLEKAVIGG